MTSEAVDAQVKLSLRDISKVFRVRDGKTKEGSLLQVLRGLSFDVYDGEIVSLIGESGCGKTTLLRVIQGLLRKDRGDVVVDGEVSRGPGRDRGFVFQQANLLPWRTATENIAVGLEIQGVAKAERMRVAEELLDVVGLTGAGRQYPHELSGGMQQRVGLARALAIDPAILLMDEPFSALDAQTREVLQRELLRVQSETGKTILFVTHDLDEALYLSNRVVVLSANPGRVKKVITVPFESPRPDLPLLRGDPAFQELRTEIWGLIRSGSGSPDQAASAGAA